MLETDSPLNHRTSPGSPSVLQPDSLLNLLIPPRASICLKQIPVENHQTSLGFQVSFNRFTAEPHYTSEDIKMSETDSCRESLDISRIPKSHLTGSLLNFITTHRISSCWNYMIPDVIKCECKSSSAALLIICFN